MATNRTCKKEDLQAVIRAALTRAETYCARYRPWDTRLLVISISCGAVATLLAGGTAAGGVDAAKAWFGGWQVLCTIVALLTAAGTVAGTLHKSLQITSKVANAERCVARLRALDATIGATGIASAQVLEDFKRISDDHAVCLA